ncbi:MAG: hypothetical protein ACE147_09845 [Candidatus Methylomirabilales bacterium]
MAAPAQLVLDVENAPGALAHVASVLRAAGVEIAGLWVFPGPRAGPFFRPAEEDARELARAAERLAEAGINLICAYPAAGGVRQIAVILKAADVPGAMAALQGGRDGAYRRGVRLARQDGSDAGASADPPSA